MVIVGKVFMTSKVVLQSKTNLVATLVKINIV